jgi:hypothetical protein
VCVLSIHHFGSFWNAVAFAKGHRLIVKALPAESSRLIRERPISLRYSVTNPGKSKITLLGSDACCERRLVNALPCVIEPGNSCELEVVVTTAPEQRQYSGRIQVFTDNPDVPVVFVPVVLGSTE